MTDQIRSIEPDEAEAAVRLLVDALMALSAIEDVRNAADPADAANLLRSTSILDSVPRSRRLAGAWESVGFVPEGGRTPHVRAQEVRAAGLKIADELASDVAE